MTSIEGYFPVPTIRRDDSSCEPIRSTSVTMLAARNRFDDLDAVALGQPFDVVLGAPHDAVVA